MTSDCTPAKLPTFVCAGTACLDLFLIGSEALPTRESLALFRSTEVIPGCSTSNTGAGLASLSLPIDIVALLGSDDNGKKLLEMYRCRGIRTRYIRQVDFCPTPFSVLPVYADGKRGIYHCTGTNAIINEKWMFGEDVESGMRKILGIDSGEDVAVFHIGYPLLMPKLQGDDLAALFRKILSVSNASILTSLDTVSLLDDNQHRKLVEPALPYTAVFHANIEEAAAIAGQSAILLERARQTSATASIEDVITPAEISDIASVLLRMGAGIVAISLGINGAYLATNTAAIMEKTCGRVLSILSTTEREAWVHSHTLQPAYRTTPGGRVNATGAGDTFVAGLLAALVWPDAVRRGPKFVLKIAVATALLRVDVSLREQIEQEGPNREDGVRMRQVVAWVLREGESELSGDIVGVPAWAHAPPRAAPFTNPHLDGCLL